MAMSKCRECGKAVSTLAKTCPSCGVPKPAKNLKKKTTTKKIITKAKKNKPSISSTKKTSNQQYVYNPNTGSFDKSSSKIKNEENYDSKTGYNPRTGSFDSEPKKTKILKAKDKINKEEQTRRQDEFRRNKQYWKDQEQIRKQDELRRKEEENIRVLEQQRRVADETKRRHEEQRIRKENEQTNATSVSSSSTNTGKKDIFDQFGDGTLDLATAFWGFFVFGSTILGVICGVLSEMVSKFFNYPYVLFTALIIMNTGKCAENYKQIMIKKNQSVVWGVLTQILCVVSFLGLILFVIDLFKN